MSIHIVFFGTGSGRPMPHRNVSGMALTREGKTYMFDCGEGTQLQLMKTPVRLGNIEAVFLSHFHGDHVNGLPGFLGSLALNQRDTPLPVFAPRGLRSWFETLHNLHILRSGKFTTLHEINENGVLFSTKEYDIIAKRLKHRVECFGFAFVEKERPGRFNLEAALALKIPPGPMFGQLQRGQPIELNGRIIYPEQVMGKARPGLKIVYCTDTKPCDAVIELAEGADLLIHESTYPAGMERDAHKRGHATAADAAQAACQAKVKRLVLTHFSQKYFDTQIFLNDARKIFANTDAASDFSEFVVTHDE